MAASRVLVYLSRGNMQPSSTPKHMHIVCMRMLTYIPSHSKFPKFVYMAEAITLVPQSLLGTPVPC